jgi:hypothetical protein
MGQLAKDKNGVIMDYSSLITEIKKIFIKFINTGRGIKRLY